MAIQKLAHFSVRTTDLEASRKFYCDVLGFVEGYRPSFNFPGLWLYRGGDEAEFGVVHIIGADVNDTSGLKDYLGDKPLASLQGGGAIDHIAFLATELIEIRNKLKENSIEFKERTVPDLHLHQLFVDDPSGITIELNFPVEEVQ